MLVIDLLNLINLLISSRLDRTPTNLSLFLYSLGLVDLLDIYLYIRQFSVVVGAGFIFIYS